MKKAADRVAAVLAKLPNNLEPDALLRAINAHTMVSKGDLDDNTLGHAYYTLYYGLDKPTSASVLPKTTSLLKMYEQTSAATAATSATASINVVKQTDPAVYVASVCDAILPYTHMIIPAPLFCQVIRNVHPRELKNDYYHDPNICGATFEEHLVMVNARLRAYFLSNRDLDDVLSGIKKCLCLRMLSSNMYYYRDNPAGLVPAIAKLMQFYTLTDFLHASSPDAYHNHLHMIMKYKQLNELIEELINPKFKQFLRATNCVFNEIVRVEPGDFYVRIRNVSHNTVHVLPRTLPMLQALVANRNRPMPPRMSSSDMVHKVQSHWLYPRNAFDEGIRFMKLLMDGKKRKLPLKSVFDDLYKIYEHTVDALILLHERNMHKDSDDEEFFTMMKQMDKYTRKYRPRMLTSGMVDWSQFEPARSPSPLTRKRARSPSPRSSRKRKRQESGGAKAKSKTRRSKRSKKVLIRR
jgi:hypothetical protein